MRCITIGSHNSSMDRTRHDAGFLNPALWWCRPYQLKKYDFRLQFNTCKYCTPVTRFCEVKEPLRRHFQLQNSKVDFQEVGIFPSVVNKTKMLPLTAHHRHPSCSSLPLSPLSQLLNLPPPAVSLQLRPFSY